MQETLREISLKVLDKNNCEKYAGINAEQKYCTGQENVKQDTCKVRISYLENIK